jgi:hypothetical protein
LSAREKITLGTSMPPRKPKAPFSAVGLRSSPKRMRKAQDPPGTADVPKNVRFGVLPQCGQEFMLFRLKVEGGWEMCDQSQPGHATDSACHRYRREISFQSLARANRQDDAVMAAAQDAIDAEGIGDIKSHPQRVNRFAYFERYCCEW